MPRSRTHVVILAGGRGTRFWPWSRRALPKPFLALTGTTTLLEDAWVRARSIAPASQIWVVVSKQLARPVRRALPRLRRDRLVIEPSPRDTAPALALAAERIRRIDPQAVFLLQPSDHAIDRAQVWTRVARRAIAAAQKGGVVSLGVPARGAETGYGYLVCDRRPGPQPVRVARFVEKPSPRRARALLATGRCLWNSGSFAARVDSFLGELVRQRPDILRAAQAAANGRATSWRRLAPISVDYAVLEGARQRQAIRLDSGWDDLGSWDVAARRARPASGRQAILIDSPGSAVFTHDRWVAVLGVPGVAVVEAPDAILVVARSRAQEVRRVVEALVRAGRKDLE